MEYLVSVKFDGSGTKIERVLTVDDFGNHTDYSDCPDGGYVRKVWLKFENSLQRIHSIREYKAKHGKGK